MMRLCAKDTLMCDEWKLITVVLLLLVVVVGGSFHPGANACNLCTFGESPSSFGQIIRIMTTTLIMIGKSYVWFCVDMNLDLP